MKTTILSALVFVLMALPANAQVGEWSVGFRLQSVLMDAETETIATTNSSVSYDSGFGLGFDVAYRFADDFALEVALTPSFHDMTVEGGLFGGRPAGDEWVVPLSLTVVYHLPMTGRFHPYFGLGANYASFLGYSKSKEMTAIGLENLDTSGSVGLTVQAGIDYELSDAWSVTFDVKYQDVSGTTDVEQDINPDYASVELDATQWQIGVGVEHRFGYRH